MRIKIKMMNIFKEIEITIIIQKYIFLRPYSKTNKGQLTIQEVVLIFPILIYKIN